MASVVASRKDDEADNLRKLRLADAGVYITEAISTFIGMQFMVFKQLVEKRNGPLFNSLLGYLFLPVATLSAIANAVFSWQRAVLRHFEGMAVAKAVMSTVAAAAMLAAVVGLLVATSLFMFVGPAIYASVVGAKGLFSAGSSIYFAVKFRHAKTDEDKADYKDKLAYAVADAICGLVIAGAMLTILLVATPFVQVAMTVVGVTASLIGYAVSRTKMKYPADKNKNADETLKQEDISLEVTSTLTNNAKLAASFGHAQPGSASSNVDESAKVLTTTAKIGQGVTVDTRDEYSPQRLTM